MAQIENPVEPETPSGSTQGQALREYARYLKQERDLAAETIRRSVRTADDLLKDCFGSRPLRWERVHARAVTRFLLRCAKRVESSTAKKIASDLRRFLRFLKARGKTVQDLSGAVPPIADRGGASLPSFLEVEEIRRLLASLDRAGPKGQRDYAILLLLARLGLRSCEVVAMELPDIDWRASELTLRGKGPRLDRLPLVQDVGEAVATYLLEARPACASKRVFVRLQPPIEGFSGSSAIGHIVRRALVRAGLAPKHQGAHLLRHSLAAEMLRRGARLSEIGQILRHRSPATTEIYARVDLAALRELTQRWPGGQR